ncbi:MAG: AP endonuclease [Desulfuromonadaceae bacterium GWB2_53_15]|nr:MAG: AP endonuclease [Desulfuromonadales bacterium GWD2_54_10]OHB27797.1 MAG: AP endonuclease [Desulfuromonadaceae bacterium GWB2_53_15]
MNTKPTHNHIHCHVPYPQLSSYLDYVIARQINPEVFFSAEALDHLVWEELAAQSQTLHTAGLATTIHAPFLDLNPGALDPIIRQATLKRFQQVIQAAEVLRPRVIVFHPGYDELRYGDNRMAWLKNSISFWQEILPRAKELGSIIAVENIFEKEPSTLRGLLEAIDDPCFRHCFDVGHWNMFTTVSIEAWFAELGPYIAECHIHDNHGHSDEHLPLGEGLIDFNMVFKMLKYYAPDSVWTIEAHSKERLERALKAIENYV